MTGAAAAAATSALAIGKEAKEIMSVPIENVLGSTHTETADQPATSQSGQGSDSLDDSSGREAEPSGARRSGRGEGGEGCERAD